MLFSLIPLCAGFKNSSISLRSFVYSPLIFTARCHFAVLCRLRRRLMKWWAKGIAIPRWTSWPIFVSSSFAVIIPSESIVLITLVHTLYLFFGRKIKSCLKSINQPRIVFLSSSGVSDASLLHASITSQGIGLCWCSGHSKCLLLEMVHGCIVLNCLSLWFPPSEKLDCRCRCCSFL